MLCIPSVEVTCRTYFECVLRISPHIPNILRVYDTSDIRSAYGEYVVLVLVSSIISNQISHFTCMVSGSVMHVNVYFTVPSY